MCACICASLVFFCTTDTSYILQAGVLLRFVVVHPGASNSFRVTVVLHLAAPLKSNYLFGQVGQKVVPVGSAPRAPPEGSWASAASTWAIHTSLPQLLTHALDYFPISSQRHIPSPRLVSFVPPINFFPHYANDVWADKLLCHFLKGSWTLFWVAFGIVRSMHHRDLQPKRTDSQIRQERDLFLKAFMDAGTKLFLRRAFLIL